MQRRDSLRVRWRVFHRQYAVRTAHSALIGPLIWSNGRLIGSFRAFFPWVCTAGAVCRERCKYGAVQKIHGGRRTFAIGKGPMVGTIGRVDVLVTIRFAVGGYGWSGVHRLIGYLDGSFRSVGGGVMQNRLRDWGHPARLWGFVALLILTGVGLSPASAQNSNKPVVRPANAR